MKTIDLNGTIIKVPAVRFEALSTEDANHYRDCYITFPNGDVVRYDADDVTLIWTREVAV